MTNPIKPNIVLAITGASGSVYAKVLLDNLKQYQSQIGQVAVVLSDNAKTVWQHELGNKGYEDYDVRMYDKNDFMAPFASGSSSFNTMIICPCSMGTLARIAHGVSSDLTTRAADVMLKERRKLIVVARETPLSNIHLKNMLMLSEAGAIICPATPSFYSKPQNIEQVASTVVDRILDLIGLEIKTYRWNG